MKSGVPSLFGIGGEHSESERGQSEQPGMFSIMKEDFMSKFCHGRFPSPSASSSSGPHTVKHAAARWAVVAVQPSFMSWPVQSLVVPGLGRLLPGKRLVSSHAAFDSLSNLSLQCVRAPGLLMCYPVLRRSQHCSVAFPYQSGGRSGAEMAYVEVGEGDPIVLLHGKLPRRSLGATWCRTCSHEAAASPPT